MGRQTPRTSQKSAPTKDPSGVVIRCVGVPLRPVDSLTPYAKNARTHSPGQVAKIAASLKEFGWTNPVLVDAEGIIAGHGRLMAAKVLGMPAVPCLDLDGLTKAQRRAYILADNKLALDAGWDDEVLALELSALAEDGFDLSLAGFDPVGDVEIDMPTLRTGEKEPFQQVTFTLHDDQVEQVKEALRKAIGMGDFDGPNENSNGNALARVCETFLTAAA